MELAFATGVSAPHISTSALAVPASLRGGASTQPQSGLQILACALGPGVAALTGLNFLKRKGRKQGAIRGGQPSLVVVAAAAADDERPSTLPSRDKTADGSISLGQPVKWNGKTATVKYIGEVKFAKGEWVGLELADGVGVHDGNVMGVPYFECPSGKGVFAQAAQLSASAPKAAALGSKAAADADEEIQYLPSKEKTADGSTSLGQAITWKGRKATVKYIGEVKFSKGEWLGLELADGGGVHDGSVMGVPYFLCPVGKGVFAQAAQRSGSAAASSSAPVAPTAVAGSAAENDGPTTLPSKEKTADGSISLGQPITWNGMKAIVRYIGEVKFGKGEWVGLELTDGKGVHDGNVLGVPYFECPAGKGVFAPAAQLAGGAASLSPAMVASSGSAASDNEGPTFLPSKDKSTDGSISLGQSMTWNGKKAIVRYIGGVKFGKGEWVGLEVVDGGGVHDGTVMGASYFECPAGKGVFAQVAK